MTQHHAHTVPLDEPPVTGFLLPNYKTEYIAVIRGAPLEIRDSEDEGQRSYFSRNATHPYLTQPA